jgi:hypothetical protein
MLATRMSHRVCVHPKGVLCPAMALRQIARVPVAPYLANFSPVSGDSLFHVKLGG